MICLPSINPMSITVLARYGEALHIRKVDLGFDHDEFSAIYDIEWYPEGKLENILSNVTSLCMKISKDFENCVKDMLVSVFFLDR